MPLFVGFKVVGRVEVDEGEADDQGDETEGAAEEEAEVVKGEAFPDRFFADVFEGVIARHALGLMR